MNDTPIPQRMPPAAGNQEFVRSIVLDLLLTILTCGLFNLYVQYRQIVTVNAMLGKEKYSFIAWLLLTIITCGLYHIYHEYRKSSDIAEAMQEPHSNEPIISLILTVFGLHVVADAIQQSRINKHYGNDDL